MIELYRKLGISQYTLVHRLLKYLVKNFLRSYSFIGGIDVGSSPHILHALQMTFGFYEKEYSDLFPQFLKKGDYVVDAGANVGYFSLKFSQYVGKEGCVIAFEPNPEVFTLLKKNTKKRTNIVCFNLGLSDCDDSLDLFVANDNIDTASLA